MYKVKLDPLGAPDITDKDIEEQKKAIRDWHIKNGTSDEKECISCGELIDKNSKFCTSCGTDQTLVNTPKFCPSCGSKLSDNQKFCTSCGTKV
jgi:rRNA maturation endonuclease Nob1